MAAARGKSASLRPACLATLLLLPLQVAGEKPDPHAGHAMTVSRDAVVMNENRDRLPLDCTAVSRDYSFTVKAGSTYAHEAGTIFGFSQYEMTVEPCSRIEVTFVNEDGVRHQWMVHGLPAYLYPAGMFHLEASGGASARGTFIVPGDDRTYLVHCDMAQHMEKGMRGQLVVGRGSGDLWAVSGISAEFRRSDYLPTATPLLAILALALSFLLSLWLWRKP